MRGMFRPIPRAALPDTMTVRAPLPDGTYDEPELICYVRFERTQKACDDEHGDGHRAALLVRQTSLAREGALAQHDRLGLLRRRRNPCEVACEVAL